jgi:hypothetical protein
LNVVETVSLMNPCSAAWHSTSELHEAMKETLESIVKLKAVRKKAVESFKQEGLLFTKIPVDMTRETIASTSREQFIV